MMDCRHFEIALDDLTRGLLEPARRLACEDHAAQCAACADLLVLANLPVSEAEPPSELLSAVLARTSGAPCARAEPWLPDLVDRALSGEQSELVTEHLDQCPSCAALAEVLRALEGALPRLAQVRPDPGFVDQVLRRTLPVDVQLRRWWRRTWPRWLRRPRFASEAAYVGVLVVVLVFATPGSPLEAVPQRALAAARQPLAVETGWGDELRRHLGAACEVVEGSGRRSLERWSAAAASSAGRAATFAAEVGEEAATLWHEAASLLGKDGDAADESDAARESSDSTEENP